jgi:5-hydroxyisourate hydrolase
MSPITTHILDTSLGRPAAGVAVALERLDPDQAWRTIGRGQTDADGRNKALMAPGALKPGTFRLLFEVGDYFRKSGRPSFYPSVTVVFEIVDATQHYHVPLLLNPYGYSTYRGS